MRLLVTGGAGFIGSNLVKEAISAGHSVTVIDNFSSGEHANLAGMPDVRVHESSILDTPELRRAAADAEAIVHLAAIPSVPRSLDNPRASHDANVTGTLNVLEAARVTGAHVTVASSSSVYGSNPALPKSEDMATRPLSPYAVTKQATEAYALAWNRSFDVPTMAFRFFNVFGPGQAAGHAYAAVIPAFLDAALSERSLVVHGDGRQTRDFTYVRSITPILLRAATERVTSEVPVNLAFGSRRSLLEVIGEVEHLLGRPVTREHTDPRPGDVRDSQADTTRLMQLFPDAEPISFSRGLADTLVWMRRQHERG